MTLKERIEEYCKYAKIRISAFERRAGLSNGYFNQVKKEPSPSKLSQIEEAFPDLNTDWMLTEKSFLHELCGGHPAGFQKRAQLVSQFRGEAQAYSDRRRTAFTFASSARARTAPF